MPNTSLTPDHLAQLQAWQGRTETTHDQLVAAPLLGWSAALDRDDAAPQPGAELPPLAHWLYFLPRARQSELGPDGHAKRGGFLPPVPLPRRMWAGGRLQWHAPLRVGDAVERRSRIESVAHKAGRSGELVFVQVRHEVHNAAGLALAEEHDIVYRAAPQPGAAAPAPQRAETAAPWQRELVPDAVLLFRYSALTFNGHRIHYDRSYVTEQEGYPGLVVHGPLIATLLVDLARRSVPGARLATFSFKALHPAFDQRALTLRGRPAEGGGSATLWAADPEGLLVMQAEATFS